MSATQVVLCHPARTAIGIYNGSLKAIPASKLGAAAIAETLRRSRLSAAGIQGVVMGNVIHAGGRMNPARQAAIAITAGNAPGLNSGAAAMIVAERVHRRRTGHSAGARGALVARNGKAAVASMPRARAFPLPGADRRYAGSACRSGRGLANA